jgi:rhodanese-related sulfurtransferase
MRKNMKKNVNLMLLLLIFATPAAFAAPEKAAKNVDASDAPAKQSYKPKSPKLDRAQFDALLAKPEQLLVIDLRRPDEISSIGGFPVYLSIQADQLEKSLAFIPKDRAIVTVSNHSNRSGKSADLLASKGFTIAGYVGAQYYEEEGGKLTKIIPPPPKVAAKK